MATTIRQTSTDRFNNRILQWWPKQEGVSEMSHTNQPITLGIFHSVQQMLSYSFYSEEKALFFFSRIGKLVTRLCIADARSGDQFASWKVMLKKKKDQQKNITCWAAAFCWVQHNVVQECSLGEGEERAGFPL